MKLYIFDLDGVLIDSKKTMEIAWEECRRVHNIESLNLNGSNSFDSYFLHIGQPFEDIMHKLGIHASIAEIKKTYIETSLANLDKTKPYDGVFETLGQLNAKKAIVTSKPIATTNKILEDWPIKFDSVVCPCDHPSGIKHYRGKPAPDMLLNVISRLNEDPQDSVYIGDTQIDQQSANRAGTHFYYADYGYGTAGKYLKHETCDRILKSITQLI